MKIIIFIWLVISIITLALEFAVVNKLVNDKEFVDEFYKIFDEEEMKKYAKSKKWLIYAVCPIFHILICLGFIIIYIYELINFDDFREQMLLELKKKNNIEG